jgi:hypothetical protein
MVAFDDELLRTDPALLAGGGPPNVGTLESIDDDRAAPACQAALASFRTARMFQTLFTAVVFVVAAAAAAALVFSIVRIARNGADLTAVVSGVNGVVASGATVWLAKRMQESIRVARTALADVGKYCGAHVQSKVE